MPNAIKYSTTGDTLSLKKGNIFFGVGDVGKGPSSATTYYNGVTPSAGGYTIYSYNASQTSKLSFHTAVDDAALRDYTNRVSGESFASAAQCLNWYATQTNYVCVNRDYEGIVTSGLTFCLDAGFTPSYTTSGTTWYDIGYNNYDGTLTNGPTFNSGDGGSIVFDGVDDYVGVTNGYTSVMKGNDYWTVSLWFRANNLSNNPVLISPGAGQLNYFDLFLEVGPNSVFFSAGGGSGTNYLQNTSTPLVNNTIYNINYIKTGPTTGKVYVNGNEISLTTIGSGLGTMPNSNADFRIGGFKEGSFYLNGNIYNVSMYNRSLSPTEVLRNFNAQKSRYGL